jgi:photosystem II stability/assembly factor-like uncharacterized protein
VTCPSTSFCLAVGANQSGSAVVATSSDGGNTWDVQATPDGAPELDAVACATADDCVAVGSKAILTTIDGGQTWSMQPPPVVNTTLLGVTCTDVLLCVAVGETVNTAGPYAGQVDVSDDGGVTWASETLPTGTLGIGSVVCPSETDCVAVGASIVTSQDAGVTWQLGTVNGVSAPMRTIACSSPEVCIAVGVNALGEYEASAPGSTIVTTDGGATWNPGQMPSNSSGVSEISCADLQCWAAGNLVAHGSSTVVVQMESSSDGGMTWSPVTPPTGVTAIASLSCPGPDECVAVGQSSTGPAIATLQSGSWSIQPATEEMGAQS